MVSDCTENLAWKLKQQCSDSHWLKWSNCKTTKNVGDYVEKLNPTFSHGRNKKWSSCLRSQLDHGRNNNWWFIYKGVMIQIKSTYIRRGHTGLLLKPAGKLCLNPKVWGKELLTVKLTCKIVHLINLTEGEK